MPYPTDGHDKYNVYYDGVVYNDIDPDVTAAELEEIMKRRKKSTCACSNNKKDESKSCCNERGTEYESRPSSNERSTEYESRPSSNERSKGYESRPSNNERRSDYESRPSSNERSRGYESRPNSNEYDSMPSSTQTYDREDVSRTSRNERKSRSSSSDNPNKTVIKRRRMTPENSKNMEVQCNRSKEDLKQERKSQFRRVSIPDNIEIIPVPSQAFSVKEIKVRESHNVDNYDSCDPNCFCVTCDDPSDASIETDEKIKRHSVYIHDSLTNLRNTKQKSIIKRPTQTILEESQPKLTALVYCRMEMEELRKRNCKCLDPISTVNVEGCPCGCEEEGEPCVVIKMDKPDDSEKQ